jgi:hypothetical protein
MIFKSIFIFLVPSTVPNIFLGNPEISVFPSKLFQNYIKLLYQANKDIIVGCVNLGFVNILPAVSEGLKCFFRGSFGRFHAILHLLFAACSVLMYQHNTIL